MAEQRTAIVTGASSGIGRAIAVAFGGLGWRVGVGARRVAPLRQAADEVKAAGGEAFAHALDVTDPSSAHTFFTAVEAVFGPVDVLVNNAGMSTPGRFHLVAVDALQQEVATNLLGPMYLSRLAIASLLGRGAPGDLVFISSDASRQPRPRMVAYTATKAGLEAMARSLAMELEGTGIRPTTIRLGPTLSDFAAHWSSDEVRELMTYWPRYGLQRHLATLEPAAVARAVVTAVTAPPGVHIDTIEVQPEAPVAVEEPASEPEPPPAP